jgi:hypothetical protein
MNLSNASNHRGGFRLDQGLTLLGLPGLLGLALLVLAAWLYWGEAPLEAQALSEQEEALTLLRDQLKRATPGDNERASLAIPSSVDTEALWQQLWQFLPDAAAGHRMQADVMSLARKRGIQLGSVQFRGEAVPGLPGVWRQRITLPVEAPYPAVRAWLNDVLQAPAWGPAVSLDALSIERSDVMGDAVKARVVWSLWWKVTP